ncbi:MAG TPA: hypothetical protein VGK00_11100 [Anaerolineales bacterium]|jgi:hypothetical protein
MNFEPGRLFTPRVFAGALIVTVLLLVLAFAWVAWSAPASPDASGLLAVVTSIPMPSTTPAPEATPTFDPYAPTPTPTPAPGQLSIGAFVQISGTQGEGLRIRSDPGLDGKQLFLGFDTEAYTVVDGPREVDGYTWYFLAAINDQKRTGWAASNFLTVIQNP